MTVEGEGRAGHVPGRLKFLVCVDRRPQSRVALQFAALRARNSGGSVTLLHVIEPPEFQHFATIGDMIEEERRAEAEALLAECAAEVEAIVGRAPETVLRVGDVGREIRAHVTADPTIDLVVMGAVAPKEKGYSRTLELAEALIGSLAVPLVIVPGNLTLAELEAMT